MNYLGIDWGQKQIGLAVGSLDVRLARPLPSTKNNPSLWTYLRDICKEEAIGGLVIGLPRNLSGEETKASQMAREFAQTAQVTLNLPVVLQDETLTTQAAEQSGSTKFDTHSLAAGIILQDYLDGLKRQS